MTRKLPPNADETLLPQVCKPRQGAGSTNVSLAATTAELKQAVAAANRQEMVVQQFVEGEPASVAVLAGPAGCHALLPARQRLSKDGRFRYLGGTAPLPEGMAERTIELGLRVVRSIPGMMGYVGVDLVLGRARDGSEDWVIEVNPRLTTSYLGLRRLARFNIAETMLRIVQGERPRMAWRRGVRASWSVRTGRVVLSKA